VAKKRSFGIPRVWQYVGLAVVGAVVLGLSVAALQPRTPTVSAQERPALTAEDFTTDAPTDQPTAVFLGDSFVEGGQVSDAERFVTLVSDHFGWTPVNEGEGGTGFITDGPAEFPERAPLTERVSAVVASAPDVVVVAAGINDTGRGYTDDQVRAAVTQTLTDLRAGLPNAQIYVVGPFWPNGYPTESALTVNAIVAEVAASLSMPFIDPIVGGWITGTNDGAEPGNRVDFIGPDGTHPTVAGHAWIAEQIIAALESNGVTAS